MNQKKRYISIILCGIFVAVLLASGALIATHVHHNCQGESCSICATISSWERLLRVMAFVAALRSVLLLFSHLSGISMTARFGGAAVQTPVTLKEKLSD